jgi:glycosyltransferase EpsD
MNKESFINKKVLFTSHKAGFANSFNRPLIKLFRDAGSKVHYASNGDQDARNCDKQFTLPISRSPFSFGNFKAYKQLKRIIETEKYDIIHCHTPTGGVVTRLAARHARENSGTRVIYTAHGFHFFKGAPLLNWLIYYPIEKVMAHFTDTLITINEEDYNRAKRNFKTNVEYIAGIGLDEEKLNVNMTITGRKKLRQSLGLKDNDFVMIYPAELSRRKRQVWLMHALNDLLSRRKDIHLLLPGTDSLNGECQTLVRKLHLEKQVHFLGYRKDIPELLRVSNLAISSSLQEGLPVNIMEALYVGQPVVATDCRGNSDLLRGVPYCYIVPRDDRKQMAERIEYVYRHKGDINYRNKLASKFYLASVLPRMEQIYDGGSRE